MFTSSPSRRPTMSTATRTAIIGVGNIGSRLATRFAQHNIPITVAASNLENAQKVAQQLGQNATAATTEEAIANNDVIILAIPFAAGIELVQQYREQLSGKTVVDPSNNIAFDEQGNALNLNPEGVSAGQQMSKALGEGVHYVKSFGTMAAAELEKDRADHGGNIVMLYATDDDAAGNKVAALAEQAGWDPVKAGGVDDTARIEVFGDLHTFGGLQDTFLNKEEMLQRI
ncbi:NADPH-dependent F420 reductase [Corynebacterium sp. 70RC1]|uniref:NADPH-dependent F420 reductase n=1 Tax=unclassified Corynebacterium TaxID=2624378 RepID=UPI0035931A96